MYTFTKNSSGKDLSPSISFKSYVLPFKLLRGVRFSCTPLLGTCPAFLNPLCFLFLNPPRLSCALNNPDLFTPLQHAIL